MKRFFRIMLCLLLLASGIPLVETPQVHAANLPQDWNSTSYNGSSGSSNYDNVTGAFMIDSSGNGITNQTSSDEQFQYAYTSLNGDFTFITRLNSYPYVNGAQAGILVRSDLEVGGPFLYGYLYGTGDQYQPYVSTKAIFSTSAASNSGYKIDGSNVSYDFSNLPKYMRVRKQWNDVGNKADLYYDLGTSDGTNITWTQINGKSITDPSLHASSTMYVGLAVGKTASATFDSVTLLHSYNNDPTTPLSSVTPVPSTPVYTPDAPISLIANGGDSNVELSWNTVTAATYYNVKRSENQDGGEPYRTIATNVTSATYSDTSVTNGTIYYYVVTACNDTGESGNSIEVNAQPDVSTNPREYILNDSFENRILGVIPIGYTSLLEQSDINNLTVVNTKDVASRTNTWYSPMEVLPASNISPEIQGNSTHVLWVNDNANAGRRGSFVYAFDPVTGNKGVTVELDFMEPKVIGDSYALELVDSNNKTALSFNVGASPVKIEANKWYTVKYIADVNSKTADLYINGDYQGNMNFTNPVNEISKIQARTAGSSTGSMYIDNISIYEQQVTTPQKLVAEGANQRVELNWNVASGIDSYQIYRSDSKGGSYKLIASDVPSNSYSDTNGLTNGTYYYYKVTAIGASGESDYSNEAEAYPNNVATPTAEITDFEAVVRDSQLTLTWSSVPGATFYTLQRSTTPGGPFIPLMFNGSEKLTVTSYLDVHLTDGTEYYYLLTAGNVGGLGSQSLLEKVSPAAPLGAPILISLQSGNNQVNLNWTSVAKATHYRISRSIVNGGPYDVLAQVEGTSYSDTTAMNGTTYYYVVTATNANQDSMISNQQKAKPYAPIVGAPDKPSSIQAVANDGSVDISWGSVEGSISYNVKRANSSDGQYTIVSSDKNETSFTDHNVVNGVTYYYMVSAVNSNGESPDTDELVVLPAKVLTVDKNANADEIKKFNTIQSAIDQIPTNNTERTIIYISPGTYTEKLTISSPYVSLVGAGMDETIIVYGDYAGTSVTAGQPGHTGNTFLSQTVAVNADYFNATNLTIENSSGPRSEVAQAVALSLKSDMAAFESVKLVGYQDTLYNGLNPSGKGRHYFHNSIIQGDVDYIFGEAPAVVMDNVKLVLVSNSGGGGHITAGAQKNTTDKGYVFLNSHIVDDSSASGTYDLGRAWKDYARVSFINTMIDSKNFLAGGWSTSCAGTCKQSYFSEYNSYGPGADPYARQVSTQLTGSEASMTIPQIFNGWDPSIQVVMPKVNNLPVVVAVSASFDKNPVNQTDIHVRILNNGHEWMNITNGASVLEASDYTINGNVISIGRSYLAGLPEGATILNFNFDTVSVPITVNVRDTSTSDIGKQVLGVNDGWGSFTTGTKGGSAATSSNVYIVTKRSELIQALGGDNSKNALNATPKIIYIKGTVDMNVDEHDKPVGMEYYADPAYDFNEYLSTYDPAVWGRTSVPAGLLENARATSEKNQSEQIKINIGSNTTLVGLTGSNARILGSNLSIQNVDNVIIRNIAFENTFDYFPQWDPTDGDSGNWNSAFDNISIKGSTHIWVDHNTFSDGNQSDEHGNQYFGRHYQQHDGLLDITNASDLVTVSYNHFHDHDKTSLVGGSDSFAGDAGKERITFHHNYYQNVKQRAPRVRYGQVHLYNNYYEGMVNNAHSPYLYSIGVGYESQIYAQNNYFKMDAGTSATSLIQVNGGTSFTDTGSILNGKEVQIAASNGTLQPVNWTPMLFTSMDQTMDVPSIVRTQAGAERTTLPDNEGDNPSDGSDGNNGNNGNNGNVGNSGNTGNGNASNGNNEGNNSNNPSIVDLTGAVKENTKNGIVTVTIDASKVATLVSKAPRDVKKFILEVKALGNSVKVEVTSELLNLLASINPEAIIVIQSENGTYNLPLKLMDVPAFAKQMSISEKDVKIILSIEKIQGTIAEEAKSAATKLGARLLSGLVEFSITMESSNGIKQEVSRFNTFVERSFNLHGVVNHKTATGVMYNPDTQKFTPVPTMFNGSQVTMWRQGNSIYAVMDNPVTFADIDGHWAKADVESLASKWIVNGVSKSLFAPDQYITRAEFTALLVRALGLDEELATGFSDVTANDWFSGAIGAAKKVNLIHGFEDGTFHPNANITREQMATTIIRAMKLGGQEIKGNTQLLEKFRDRSNISSWSKDAVAQSLNAGIIEGMSNTTFAAKDNATRAQAATMLIRMLQTLKFINL